MIGSDILLFGHLPFAPRDIRDLFPVDCYEDAVEDFKDKLVFDCHSLRIGLIACLSQGTVKVESQVRHVKL